MQLPYRIERVAMERILLCKDRLQGIVERPES